MKKLSIVFLISSLLSFSMYTSEWGPDDVGPSESAFNFTKLQEGEKRSPAVVKSCLVATTRNDLIHEMSLKIKAQRARDADTLYSRLSFFHTQ